MDVMLKNPLLFKSSMRTDEEDWMLTYSDMITLLFSFFVLLVGISQFDAVKFERVAKSLEKSVGNKTTEEEGISLPVIYSNLHKIVNEEGLAEKAEVSYSPRGVVIRFKGNVLFPTGSAELSKDTYTLFNKLAEEIKSKPYKVDVEGHTDSRPISTSLFPSNWELSSARASSVVRYLLNCQVQPEKLRAVGFADTHPLRANYDENGNDIPANQAYNRRVEIIFLADKLF